MQWSIDNMKLSVHSDNVLTPSAAITKIDGAKRTVTITSPVESYTIYYYVGDDSSNPVEYTAPVELEESATLYYYAQDESGNKSEVSSIEVNCVAVKLNAPTITRTGADTYTVASSQVSTDGIMPSDMIHYTIGGGEEKTATPGDEISGVDGDIVAWTEAEGFTNSDEVTMEYFAAYESTAVWSYDLNVYPSFTGFTDMADVIDTETETTLNEKTVYNLNGVELPNLFIENSEGDDEHTSAWLLRNQSSNAFKCQYATSSIVINNVGQNNVIYVFARRDNGGNAIDGVTNGEVKYTYGDTDYFIVPSESGAVTITFRTGVSLGTITVGNIVNTLTIGDAGVATYTPAYDLDFTTAKNIVAYKATAAADGVVRLTKVEHVAAGEGVLIYSMTKGAASEEIPVAADAVEKSADNMFVGTLTDIKALATVDGDAVRYILNDGAEGLGFYRANNQKVGAGKAYLSVPAASAAKISFFSLDGTVTAIEGVEAEAAEGDKVFYNLSGQRVENPAKGLYIVNGKKVIIK